MSFIQDLRTRRSATTDELKALLDKAIAEKRDLTATEDARYAELNENLEGLNQAIRQQEDREEEDRAIAETFAKLGTGQGKSWRSRGDGFDDARRTIDRSFRSGDLPDEAAERAMALVDEGDSRSARSMAARWAVTTGDPAYLRAFTKLLSDPDHGKHMWTAQEAEAFRRVREFEAEQRAMSLVDANGGYMLPLTLDPAIILTSAGSINPMRQISRVVQTSTDQWQGVTSAGATAEWIAEATEVADGSPTLDDAPIPVHKGDAFVPFSFEIGDDAPNFVSELSKLLIDAADQLHATAFTTGTGTGQPKGLVTALAGTASEVAPTVAETFTTADVYKVLEAVPPRFRAEAAWMGNLTILDKIDQFETTNGAKQFPQAGNDPSIVLRRRAYENSNMDGVWDAAATADNHVLICGDFSNYVIVDRIGTKLELIPHLFGANRRPTLQRGALLWFRTGADCVNINAFRMLNIETTA